jgi:hypothetical protein
MNYINPLVLTEQMNGLLGRYITGEKGDVPFFVMHDGFQPGTGVIPIYTAKAILGACCTPGTGGGNINNVEIPVTCIKAEDTFCVEQFMQYVKDATLKIGAQRTTLGSVEAVLADQWNTSVAQETSKLSWQGDTAGTSYTELDGFLKQIATATPITATNLYEAVKQLVNALPQSARDKGVEVYMAQALFDNFITGLSDARMGYTQNNRELTIGGLGGAVIRAAIGLNGTTQIVATSKENLHWLTNMNNDYTSSLSAYSETNDNWILRTKTIWGVGFGFADEAVKANLTTAQASAIIGIPVTVTNAADFPGATA